MSHPCPPRHLDNVARGHSIFWRMLRPEYVRSLEKPLSPDANCAVTSGTADGDLHTQRARAATKNLVGEVLAGVWRDSVRFGFTDGGDVGRGSTLCCRSDPAVGCQSDDTKPESRRATEGAVDL